VAIVLKHALNITVVFKQMKELPAFCSGRNVQSLDGFCATTTSAESAPMTMLPEIIVSKSI
jgi:hypothetical protein